MSAMSKGVSATTLKSVKDAKDNLKKFLQSLETIPAEEVRKSAETIQANAIAMTPYKTGKLERSVYARPSSGLRRYGIVAGASAKSPTGYNYAGIQHEETTFNHPIKGRDHFISVPFNKEVAALKRRIRRRLKFPK